MYGRADGMPSFQLTVAVRAEERFLLCIDNEVYPLEVGWK